MRLLLFLSTIAISTVISLKCTVCDFHLLPPYNSPCNETCEGDVCFIVVNKYFNGTINAGCMHLRDDDSFDHDAVCQRGPHDNRCACTSSDYCNNPKVSISSYTFTSSPILESYQWVPQIQPPMPSVQPVVPEDLGADFNETATELENGVESDLVQQLENDTVTQIQRNEENLLTVTTTIGLNVRDQTQRDSAETTPRSFTPGQGTVEVTKVTQEAPPPTVPRNLTVSDGVDASAGSLKCLLVTVIPILLHKII
uniref:EB domain-containing protein n=2 Tax=Caenorhabditis tropicalis TaxID=1561998 RepID=A0A1I7UMH4_9PELO